MLQGVFGRVDFREDGKKMRENEEEKLFGKCLVGMMTGKNDGRARVFSPWPYHQNDGREHALRPVRFLFLFFIPCDQFQF